MRPDHRLVERLAALLIRNGCDCPCEHHPEEHGDECEPCLACRVSEAVHEYTTAAGLILDAEGRVS